MTDLGYKNYDTVRFVYQTPVGSDLTLSAAQAVKRAEKYTGPSELGHAFRVIDNSYSVVIDAEREEYGSRQQLEITAFPIVKVTPTGFRILRGGRYDEPETRFVSEQWTKQWANRTPEDAVRSYIARRKRQASIYESRAQVARYMMSRAEAVLGRALLPT